MRVDDNCDERGTSEYNVAPGECRSKATMSYFVSKGIPADRITVVSYGKERPGCTEHDQSCWARNRRDDVLSKPKVALEAMTEDDFSLRRCTICATGTVVAGCCTYGIGHGGNN